MSPEVALTVSLCGATICPLLGEDRKSLAHRQTDYVFCPQIGCGNIRPLWRTVMIRLVLLIATTILSCVGSAKAQQELRVGLMNAEPGVINKDNQLRGRDIDIWNAI